MSSMSNQSRTFVSLSIFPFVFIYFNICTVKSACLLLFMAAFCFLLIFIMTLFLIPREKWYSDSPYTLTLIKLLKVYKWNFKSVYNYLHAKHNERKMNSIVLAFESLKASVHSSIESLRSNFILIVTNVMKCNESSQLRI